MNSLKRDSTFAGLSNLKLQQGTVSTLRNASNSGVLVDEFILNCLLLSIDQHYAMHSSFPKSWDSIVAFLEKVLFLAILVCCLCIFLLPNAFTLCLEDGTSQLTCDVYDVSVTVHRRPPSTLLIGGQYGVWIGSHNSRHSDDLPIPHLSSPSTDVLEWNRLHPKFLDNVFDFASSHLQDARAILLFSDDLDLKATLRGFNNTYGFRVFREWLGINRLRMISAKDKSSTVHMPLLLLLLLNFWLCICFDFISI